MSSIDISDIGKNVTVVMSLGRIGFTETSSCLMALVRQTGVNHIFGTGAFWDQSLTNAMEEAIAATPYLLTLDHDSVFVPGDVLHLYALTKSYRDFHAIAATQIIRGGDRPLHNGSNTMEKTLIAAHANDPFSGELMRAHAAHFGLTMFRSAAFTDLPRPWFRSMPNEDGRWGDGRVDSDIGFWANWDRFGRTLHIAKKVEIGHLEEMIRWPDGTAQHVRDYAKNGRPKA